MLKHRLPGWIIKWIIRILVSAAVVEVDLKVISLSTWSALIVSQLVIGAFAFGLSIRLLAPIIRRERAIINLSAN